MQVLRSWGYGNACSVFEITVRLIALELVFICICPSARISYQLDDLIFAYALDLCVPYTRDLGWQGCDRIVVFGVVFRYDLVLFHRITSSSSVTSLFGRYSAVTSTAKSLEPVARSRRVRTCDHNPVSSVDIHVRTARLGLLAPACSMPCVKVYIPLGHLCEVRPETMPRVFPMCAKPIF